MSRKALETEQKALEMNLDDKVYGTLAEIGAGQEVARYFFQVGAAAGTVAKTMSAYDKTYSDAIYGPEKSNRYVCESRLYKMLDHEYELMESRLGLERPETCFFAFADTVAAINYSRTIKGNGWLGLRFQTAPDEPYNDFVLHVRMKDQSNGLQQQAIGILGVNMIYAAFRYNNDPETMVESLMDHLEQRVSIDMIRLTGPKFDSLDNRLISLFLIKHKMTEAAMFDENGRNIHASEFLYKKNLLIVRGSYRPTTLVNENMIKSSYSQFLKEPGITSQNTEMVVEITLENLMGDGELNYQDFLDRSEILSKLGHKVVLTSSHEQKKLIKYLGDYRVLKMGIVIGARPLLDTLNRTYEQFNSGRLLAGFGEIFSKNVKIFVFPAMQEGSEELMACENLPIPEEIKFLYKHLLEQKQIVNIEQFDRDILHIYSKDVLKKIRSDQEGWEHMVSDRVRAMIKEKCLFNFPCQRMEFEY